VAGGEHHQPPVHKDYAMNRQLASALAIVSTAAAAIALATLASGKAHADDITVDNTPFVGSKTRAEVQAELLGQSAQVRAGTSEWGMQYNDPSRVKTAYTSEEAKAEFKTSRQFVSALTSEDSGSTYFLKTGVPYNPNPSAVMGAPAR
jgi:hypothetical protein